MSSDYFILLKDPRWIKKSRAIRERDGKKCTVCGSKRHLEVHHTYYYSDRPVPWKYPDESLLTLCSKCHHEYHEHFETEIRKPPGKKRIKGKNKRRVKKYHQNKKTNQLTKILRSHNTFLSKFKY